MRILVVRPQADAERTAARLAALGHEPVIAPVLTVARTLGGPPAGPFDAFIVTSVNAVPALPEIAGASAPPVFAVGARTAGALAGGNFARVHKADGDAAALAALVRRHIKPGARLLHVAGRDRKPEPGASLRAAGYAVEVWAAYEAQAAPLLPDAAACALGQGELDAALHYSRRSALTLLR